MVGEPVSVLTPRFSSGGATATAWQTAAEHLRDAELYWLSTVRPDGRPHVTPLIAVWLDDAMYFCTGWDERKAKNIAENPHCILTTGCNALNEGLDIVLEGDAVRVTDDAALRRIADTYEQKYGSVWRFAVRDGHFFHEPDSVRGEQQIPAVVFRVAPVTVFGFGKGDYSQTRYRF